MKKSALPSLPKSNVIDTNSHWEVFREKIAFQALVKEKKKLPKVFTKALQNICKGVLKEFSKFKLVQC